MSLSHPTRNARRALIATAVACATLAGGSAASAQASSQLINAGSVEFGGPALALEAGDAGDVFRVRVKPSRPEFLRQQWNRETFGFGQFRYRNVATNTCLVVPQNQATGGPLTVASCNSTGTRSRWVRIEAIPGNGAKMLLSVHNERVALPSFFSADPTSMTSVDEGDALSVGSLAEWIGT